MASDLEFVQFITDQIESDQEISYAKPAFLIEDQIEDRAWTSKLIKVTEAALPKPKPKKKTK